MELITLFAQSGALNLLKKALEPWEDRSIAAEMGLTISGEYIPKLNRSPAIEAAMTGRVAVLEYLFSRYPPTLSLLQEVSARPQKFHVALYSNITLTITHIWD